VDGVRGSNPDTMKPAARTDLMLSGWVLASTPDLTQADKPKKFYSVFHSGFRSKSRFLSPMVRTNLNHMEIAAISIFPSSSPHLSHTSLPPGNPLISNDSLSGC
jgi:hypothetical protein